MLIFFNLLRTKYKVRLYRFKYINGFPQKKKKSISMEDYIHMCIILMKDHIHTCIINYESFCVSIQDYIH